MAPERTRECHHALAELYAASGLVRVPHLFAAGRQEQGLDALLEELDESRRPNRSAQHVRVSSCEHRGELRAGDRARRRDSVVRKRQQQDLLRWATGLSVASGDAAAYWRVAPAWLEQLKHDSGLALWEADTDTSDAGARLMRALQGAVERFGKTPEAERVYPVDQAIKLLAEYVVYLDRDRRALVRQSVARNAACVARAVRVAFAAAARAVAERDRHARVFARLCSRARARTLDRGSSQARRAGSDPEFSTST